MAESPKECVAETLALLAGMQQLRLVPTDVSVSQQNGVKLTGIGQWSEPLGDLTRGTSDSEFEGRGA